MAELPVMGSLRTQLLTEVEPVRSLVGLSSRSAHSAPVGRWPNARLFEQVDVQSYELAQDVRPKRTGYFSPDLCGRTISHVVLDRLMGSEQPATEDKADGGPRTAPDDIRWRMEVFRPHMGTYVTNWRG